VRGSSRVYELVDMKKISFWRWLWRIKVRGLLFISGLVLIFSFVDRKQFHDPTIRAVLLISGLILISLALVWWYIDFRKE
jgi:hypothetical protein